MDQALCLHGGQDVTAELISQCRLVHDIRNLCQCGSRVHCRACLNPTYWAVDVVITLLVIWANDDLVCIAARPGGAPVAD